MYIDGSSLTTFLGIVGLSRKRVTMTKHITKTGYEDITFSIRATYDHFANQQEKGYETTSYRYAIACLVLNLSDDPEYIEEDILKIIKDIKVLITSERNT